MVGRAVPRAPLDLWTGKVEKGSGGKKVEKGSAVQRLKGYEIPVGRAVPRAPFERWI